MNQNKVWIITGCSTGFGRELAKATIKAGYNVVVTARNLNAINDLISGTNVLAIELDVTKPDHIEKTVNAAIEKFGRIDVLVNNAGIGYFSSFEEAIEEEARKMFEINFWGLVHMTNAVLPHMRSQRSGHIINISSIGGFESFPGVSYYNGSKHAVEGISASIAKEVAPFNINVTLIEPSNFRTDWAGRSAAKTRSAIKEYEDLISHFVNEESLGKEAGDPEKFAETLISIAESEEPPLRLLLGAEAYQIAMNKFTNLLKDIDKWKEVTLNVDFKD